MTKFTMLLVAAAFSLCGIAQAQDGEKRVEALDLTMTLLPEHATGPEEITRRIELPPPPEAGESAKPDDDAKPHDDKTEPLRDEGKGNAAAEEARERGKEVGKDASEQARERGKEVGKDASEQARENRENAGHGNNGNGNNDSNPGKGPPSSPPGRP